MGRQALGREVDALAGALGHVARGIAHQDGAVLHTPRARMLRDPRPCAAVRAASAPTVCLCWYDVAGHEIGDIETWDETAGVGWRSGGCVMFRV